MPITATCANPACGRTLRVGDHYAGKKGKCPSCGGIVVFPVPVEEIEEIVEEFQEVPASTAIVSPPLAGGSLSKPWQMPAVPVMVSLAIGLVFLVLLLVSFFLSLVHIPEIARGVSIRGPTMIARGNGSVLFIMGLALLVAVPLSVLFADRAGQVASVASGYGNFVLLCFLSGMIEILRGRFSLGVGMYLGMAAALVTAGALGAAAGMANAPWPFTAKKRQGPLARSMGLLLLAHGLALACGLIFLVISLIRS